MFGGRGGGPPGGRRGGNNNNEGAQRVVPAQAYFVALQEPNQSIDYYLKSETGEGLKFKEELANILKQ